MNVAFRRNDGGSGNNLRCDLCRRSFVPVDGYFRCNDAGCDYDICKQCGAFAPDPVPANAKRCASGHPLSYKTQPVARLGGGSGGRNLACDICRRGFSASEGYYRCDHSCNYDLCKGCGSPGPLNNVITCKQGHPIQLFRTGETKRRRNAQNNIHVYQGDLLICNSCRKHFTISSRGGSYSCRELCDFDLCVNCTRCANGHLLGIYYGNPYTHLGPTSSARCDRCRSMIPDVSNGFPRCDDC